MPLTKDQHEVAVGSIVWNNYAQPSKIISFPDRSNKEFAWFGNVKAGTYTHVGNVSDYYSDEANALRDRYASLIEEQNNLASMLNKNQQACNQTVSRLHEIAKKDGI